MKQVSAQDLFSYIFDDNSVIVDLRSEKEYRKQHVKNAVNIQIENIERNTHNLPKDKEIILYCERGGLSSMAAGILEKNGYDAKSVVGGMKALKVIDIEGYGP